MKSYMKHYKGDVEVIPTLYFDGTTALQLVATNTGEPIAKATSNLPDQDLPNDHVFIKDYSENEGVLDTLTKGGIIELTEILIVTNHVTFPLCKIINEQVLADLEAVKRRVI